MILIDCVYIHMSHSKFNGSEKNKTDNVYISDIPEN